MRRNLQRLASVFTLGRVSDGSPSRRLAKGRQKTLVAAEPLEPRVVLDTSIFISELLAANSSGLKDQDGDTSDWIEVFNSGGTPVNLDGWHLTDEADELDKWEFPSRMLKPQEFLVVFASGKDRRPTEGELHTNFRLSAQGEYLALVQPDGRTVVSEFNPYPPQYTDVSYGLEQDIRQVTLVGENSPVRVLLPTSSTDVPASQWTRVDYSDSAWPQRVLGIGYDTDPADGDFLPLIGSGGDLSAMNGSTPSAYVRSAINLSDPLPGLADLELSLRYDDGFVAYLNGTEIARRNAPDAAVWNSTATREHGGMVDERDYSNFDDADDRDDLRLLGSAAWIGNRLQLTPSVANQTGAAWVKDPIAFGSDYSFNAYVQIDVHSPNGSLDPDGLGGEGLTFVLQSGGDTRLGGPGGQLGLDGTGMQFVAVELDSVNTGSFDPDSSLPSHLGIDTSLDGNVARAAIPRFNGHALFLNEPGPGVNLLSLWVDYDGKSNRMDVYFATDASKPSVPVLTATVDLEQVFGGIPELWAGFTAATSGAYNGHEVLALRMSTGAGQLGLDEEIIPISEYRHLLEPGKNILAVHGLNINAVDEDFLIAPTLTAQEISGVREQYFTKPTPGERNGVGGDAPSGVTLFSHRSGTFAQAFDLTLIPPAPDATIRYTTDGSIPSSTSTVYTNPLRVDRSMRIRARAFQSGRDPGPVHSEVFVAVDSSLTNFEKGQPFSSNLPLMIFDSLGPSVDSQDTRFVPVAAVFIDPGEDGRAGILEQPEYAGRAGLRIRGQTSQGFAKKSYALEIWDEGHSDRSPLLGYQTEDKSVSLFGLPDESDWVLHGPYSDKTQLNNYLSFLWSNKMGLYAPRGRLVEVFVKQSSRAQLNYNSDYRGTYVLLEKIKIDDNRVDVAQLTPQDNAEPEVSGGYIWKKDKAGAGDVPFTTSRGQQLRMVDPDDRTITAAQKNWLRGYINEFEAALYGPNFADPERGYAKYIDVDSWVDTWILVEMTKNIDGFRLSTYYHKDRNGKIKQGPAWDYNLSLGNANYLRGAYPEGWYYTGIGGGDYPYWSRLFQDPNFAQKLADRWNELRQTVFRTEALLEDVDAAVDLLSDGNPRLEQPAAGEPSNPISRNFRKWGTLGTYLWPNCYFGQGDCPPSPLPGGRRPNRYSDYIFLLKRFVEQRMAWIDSQFPAGPALNPPGGVVPKPTAVTIQVPAGQTVYYTTNGRDPRQALQVGSEITIIASGAPVEVHVPQNDNLINACQGISITNPQRCFINPVYTQGTFGETWTSGRMGVGYDTAPDYDPYIRTDVAAGMQNRNTSVYLRIPFQVTEQQMDQATGMTLRLRYDDGFVAYVWSNTLRGAVEIARANAPGQARALPIISLPYSAAATATHDDAAAVQLVDFNVSNARGHLKPGTNYLVLQGLNQSLTSSDFLIDVELVLSTTSLTLPDDVYEYSQPIIVDRNMQITARSFDAAAQRWSSPTTATYLVDVPQLAITEINYNPHDPTPAEQLAYPGVNNDDFEFIEIRNIGTATISLVGTRFTNGIDFTFPDVQLEPGQYGVVVKNRQAFRTRWPGDVFALGEFTSGNLNNGGERLTLADSAGRVLIDVEYRDGDPWPARADGRGATLQLVRQQGVPADQFGKYYHWRGSTELGGSPGRAGLPPIGIVINEVLTHTDPPVTEPDSIELLNTSSQVIDLSGWYLSDSAADFFKYRIPDGTILAPGQYRVFNETDFNPNPLNPGPKDFALNGAEGDDVWLVIAGPNGQVSRFVDDVHFHAAPNGESFGRVPNGSGRLAPMSQLTLGQANARPRVGPVIISQVQYNPGQPSLSARLIDSTIMPGDLEFIEIHNPTASAVSLRDWRIRAGVSFDFASDQTLGPGQTLVVIPFDPEDAQNATRLAAFKAHYQIGSEVVLVGGYTGQLDDSTDRVLLERPDEPPLNDPTFVPRLVEDEVLYDDLVPWPVAADGTGAALERVAAGAFGNDSASWRAAAPTPGRVNFAAGVRGDFDGNNVVNIFDVNLLCGQLKTGGQDPAFDLTGDGRVDALDRDELIRNILRTTYGDANLDGRFDSTDLIQIFQAGQFEDGRTNNSGWAEGDWNCDREFDTSDLILAFQAGSYVAAAVAAGPSSPTGDAIQLGAVDAVAAQLARAPMIDRLASTSRQRASEPSARRAVSQRPRAMLELAQHRRRVPQRAARLSAHEFVFAQWSAEDGDVTGANIAPV